MPYPGLLHLELLWQATADPYLCRRHSDTVLAQSLWAGHAFVPFPVMSSSGKQVLGEQTLPDGWYVLSSPQFQLLSFLGAQKDHHLRYAMCLLLGADL